MASDVTGLSRDTIGTSASSARTRTRRVSGGSSGAWSRAASRSGASGSRRAERDIDLAVQEREEPLIRGARVTKNRAAG
jgi:hypothetical protein